MGRTQRVVAALAAASVAAVAGAALHPDTRVGYVARAARGQAALLWGRVPLDTALASGRLTEHQQARIALVRDVKAWGGEHAGLRHTDRNYETLVVGWHTPIWNVSACEPLAFEPATTWFPVVGRVPYLGFFDEELADRAVARFQAQGLDTWKRTAGAYSTLGWFRDPILPGMLEWEEDRLVEVVLHELAHTTLWIPGSVQFNESFASFFGTRAMLAWLADRHGPHSARVAEARQALADEAGRRARRHAVVAELERIYGDPTLSDDAKGQAKGEVLSRLPGPDPWNNARLMQFRVYNTHQEAFGAVLDQEGGDLARFMARMAELARAPDPGEALEAAARAR